MSITRYEDEIYGPSSYDFEENESGSWVKYEDHAAEVARLNEQVKELKSRLQLVSELNDAAAALHVEAEKQVQALAAENMSLKHAMSVTLGHVSVLDTGQAGVAAMIINDALHNSETPATDTVLNKVRAQAVDDLATEFGQLAQKLKPNSVAYRVAKSAVFKCVAAAARIRAGEVPHA